MLETINDRYGEFIMTPAIMIGMDHMVLDRISSGNVNELEDLYNSPHSTPNPEIERREP